MIFGLALVACQQHDPPASLQKPEPAVAAVDDGVTVLSAGADPKRALRYHLAKGTTSPFEITIDLDLQMGAATAAMGGPTPTLVVTGALVVDDVLPSGDLAVHIRLEHASARDRPGSKITAAMFAAQTKHLEGFVERATLSPTGQLRDAHFETPDASPELEAKLQAMSEQLEQLAVQVPAQAMGVGGRWSMTRPISTNGVHMTATLTHEVIALDGDHVTYKTTAQVTGADQHTAMNGVELDVHQIAGSGGGTGVIDLATGMVTGSYTTAFHVDIGAPDQTLQVGMAMTLAISRPQ